MRKQTKKQIQQNRKWVKRSTYQMLMARCRKLSADLRIITKEDITIDKILLIAKYREQYKRGGDFVKELSDAIQNSKIKQNEKKKRYFKNS